MVVGVTLLEVVLVVILVLEAVVVNSNVGG